MKVIQYPERSSWSQLAKRPVIDLEEIISKVHPIIDQVRREGDQALFDLTKKFDQVQLASLKVSQSEINSSADHVDDNLKDAIQIACQNIHTFHVSQKEKSAIIETMPGLSCWRKSVAIEKVGLYIPGGTAPLFSTVLMLAIPAQIAGCQEVILCTPPNKNGNIHPAILYAADLAGIKKVYKVGGAQAIAAMALGTGSISKADKIFGPGNQYVTAAKQYVNRMGTAIDMPAGPSEVAVIADSSANARFVAADLIAQTEHGVDSQAILLTNSKELIEQVQLELRSQLEDLPRAAIAKQAMENSVAILFADLDEAMAFSNLYAPEHLILSCENYIELSKKIINAGSVFMGHLTPESLGDYASGTNHTLPTNGYANTYSGVSLDSFVKKITFQEATVEGLQNIGRSVETMAEAEQLIGHKRAVSYRLDSINKSNKD